MISRTILHADMDAFYAAIEQRDDPRLRGKPVIVGGLGPRSVVCTASYEARPFGVRSAMPMALALRKCPDAIVVPPRIAAYAAVSAQVQAVFERFTPLVEPLSLDEAFLDVTQSQRLFGDGEAIARQLKAAVFDTTRLRVSVGVAPSKFVAKVASDLHKPDGLVVVREGEVDTFLAPLPVARLWGAGPRVQEQMRGAGMQTVGDVRARTGDQLVALFGPALGRHFWNLARGLDDRAVVPDREAKSISHEVTFAHDVGDLDELCAAMLEQSESVGRRLRRAELHGATVKLKLRYPDFTTLTRQRKLPAPSSDDLAIFRAGKALLVEALAPRCKLRLIGVGVSDLTSANRPQQGSLFAPPPRKSDGLLKAVDAIRARFGDGAIKRGTTS